MAMEFRLVQRPIAPTLALTWTFRTDSMLQASVLPPDTFNAHLSFDR
jgi:hypothetical protein